MTSKTKPTVSTAIDAINEISSPLDFSYKSLAAFQGLLNCLSISSCVEIQLLEFPNFLTEDLRSGL